MAMMTQAGYTIPAQSMAVPAPVTYVQAAQAAPMPTPTYIYPAGSTSVPVYGSSVNVPQIYQQPAAAMPTVAYQPAQPMTQEQLNKIFPMGAPSTSTFQPFSQPQYQFSFVDSASAFVPAAAPAAAVAPAPEAPSTTTPAATAPGASTLAPAAASTTAPTTTGTTGTAGSVKASSKKDKKESGSKKLSSKKKSKGCC